MEKLQGSWLDPTSLDLFEFWRWMLAVVCTVYAAIVLIRSAWDWCEFLSGRQKAAVVLRRYILLQLLRLRIRTFGVEIAKIIILCALFIQLVQIHRYISAR